MSQATFTPGQDISDLLLASIHASSHIGWGWNTGKNFQTHQNLLHTLLWNSGPLNPCTNRTLSLHLNHRASLLPSDCLRHLNSFFRPDQDEENYTWPRAQFYNHSRRCKPFLRMSKHWSALNEYKSITRGAVPRSSHLEAAEISPPSSYIFHCETLPPFCITEMKVDQV